jgi:hypothetical protein
MQIDREGAKYSDDDAGVEVLASFSYEEASNNGPALF